MKLPEECKRMIVDEIELCRKKMKDETDLSRKAFFFSGLYSMTNRVLNLHYDPELQFLDFVLNTTYGTINGRLGAIKQGDLNVPVSADLFDNLDKLLLDLEKAVGEGKSTHLIMQRLVNLAYLTTGNGYYLSQKGVPVFTG